MKHLLILIALILFALILANQSKQSIADSAVHKAGYVGLNAFEYVAKEIDGK